MSFRNCCHNFLKVFTMKSGGGVCVAAEHRRRCFRLVPDLPGSVVSRRRIFRGHCEGRPRSICRSGCTWYHPRRRSCRYLRGSRLPDNFRYICCSPDICPECNKHCSRSCRREQRSVFFCSADPILLHIYLMYKERCLLFFLQVRSRQWMRSVRKVRESGGYHPAFPCRRPHH